jgi:hypothetical protein
MSAGPHTATAAHAKCTSNHTPTHARALKQMSTHNNKRPTTEK